ncbi:DISARM system SNF2-like helicase DrmD [Sorangium sp. So ce1036]|uniref:DISARM system SNF2-like helicase DrmD n=1 Tax=Sorangium sp. So ce1036 TaxID=3133328 RepID=UPI003F11B5A1
MSVTPQQGNFVRVRSRLYLVDQVAQDAPDEDAVVHLSCLDDDAQGARLSVLWQSEVDARIVDAASFREVAARGLDAPRTFAAYLNAQRWHCVTSTRPRLFQAPHRAGIELHAYQLEPLRKALLLPRVNLFIADDVGLGKTIEAGLILRELLMRQRVRRVVVVAPPSVVVQWRDELESRFGLSFVILDRAFVAKKRRERGYSVNPWLTHNLFIVSHALVRDEAYVAPLRACLQKDGGGSMMILDEAHNAAPASGAKYAVDSKLTGAVRELAELFEHRLFLSATPHNGHSNSFTALLEILDPQRFTRGIPLEEPQRQLEPIMVRRLKSDLREVKVAFPRREVKQITLDGLPDDAPELVLSRMLEQYRELRARRLARASRSAQAAAGLLDISLQKRLLSSIEALRCTLLAHRDALRKAREKKQKEQGARPPAPVREERLDLLREAPGADDERAGVGEDELRREERAQVEAATRASSEATEAEELALLDRMIEVAEAHASAPDARIERLLSWIRENLCPDLPARGEKPARPARWLDRCKGREHAARVLIFTEYTDTKRYLEQQLGAALASTDRGEERVEVFHGEIADEAKREEIKRAFNGDPAEHPVRVLIATDAAREGVNLQSRCADLFHFDVPWNPSRMEQRNGRIDRKLQREEVVTCHYFLFAQRAEDRVLEVLVQKTSTIQKELGSLGAVVEGELLRLLSRGIPLRQAAALCGKIGAVKGAPAPEELEASRERRAPLEKQLATLRQLLEESRVHLGLRGGDLERALSEALRLLGAEPLRALDPARDRLPSGKPAPPGAYAFPALDRLPGADPGWAELLDALRAPERPRDVDLRAWRREATLRPVVFADTGALGAEVVHLHLEHRIVQRLLGRFRSQGFLHHDLSRATAVITDEAEPKVVLLGRLGLYGDHASRLHEEVILAAAPWVAPVVRKTRLRGMGLDHHDAILRQMGDALARGERPHDRVREDLSAAAERDVEELLPLLVQRGESAGKRAEEELAKRAAKEAADIRKVLEAQRARIRKHHDEPQQELQFTDLERRQLASERAFWEARLRTIEAEITSEPRRIERAYQVRARRLDPLGLVYLWPRTG